MHELLRGGGAVEAHDKVVAAVVEDLGANFAPREQKGAPVCYAADYAAVGEDEGAGCSGDSGEDRIKNYSKREPKKGNEGEGKGAFEALKYFPRGKMEDVKWEVGKRN